jgi:ABC-type sugar transport system ATPase subunit
MVGAGRVPALQMRSLTRRFPGVLAVNDLSVDLWPGTVVGLVGPNGAGKSTLIKMLAGAVRPDRGDIHIDGTEVDIGGALDAQAAGLSFVHQENACVASLTVAENVLLGLGYPKRFGRLVDRRELRSRALETIRLLDVDLDPDAMGGDLSLADQRMVMIGRGLAAHARVLVLDEPSASLTSDEIAHLHRVVRRVAEQGTLVIYVSHRLEEIFALTSRVVVMRSGRVVADEPTSGLDDAKLIDLITGQDRSTREAVSERAAVVSSAVDQRRVLLRAEGLRGGPVRDVSFTLHAGEVLGLAGLVGSGRTRLARLLCGADRLEAGRVCVDGRQIPLRGPADALAAGIVMLPEDRRALGLVLDSTIRENITLPSLRTFRRFAGVPFLDVRRERRAAGRHVNDLAVKTPDVDWTVGHLSGGNQQKVVLAKWLEHGAKVFIFDEPTHGIDISGKLEVYAIIGRLAEAGHGVILISSEFQEIQEVCRRSLVMREGRIITELKDDDVSVASLTAACYRPADQALA